MAVARTCAAVLTLGALALFAVYYTGGDRSEIVTEAVKDSSHRLPETVDNFLEVSVTKRASFDKFHQYKDAKDQASSKASPAAFKQAEDHCKTARVTSYKQCAKFYCTAKDTCGQPCEKKEFEPPLQVVPLTEGNGARFYKVHEVQVKEQDNKEKAAKETHAKELAQKEQTQKENKYKENVSKEKSAKLIQKQERLVKEKEHKETAAKERVQKEVKDKLEEKAHKAHNLLTCTNKADKVQHECAVAKAQEEIVKVEEKKELQEKAQLSLESAQKQEINDAHNNAANTTITNDFDLINSDHTTAMAANESALAEEEAKAAADRYDITTAANSSHAGDMLDSYDATVADLEATTTDATSVTMESFPSDVVSEINNDAQYAESVVPVGGGARRLLQTEDEATEAAAEEGTAAGSAATPTTSPAIQEAEQHVSDVTDTVESDTTTLEAERTIAGSLVNATAEADATLLAAEDVFKNHKLDEEQQDQQARFHASKAALSEAQTVAVDSYVGTHQGELHKTNCTEEKKFTFDVCFGRAAYKGQLFQTKAAKESRSKAKAYQTKMGVDYTDILNKNGSYVEQEGKEEEVENTVKAAQKKLEEDSKALQEAKETVREMKAKLAAKIQKAKQAAEDAASADAMASAMGNTNPAVVAADAAATDSADAAKAAAAEVAEATANTTTTTSEEMELYSVQAELFEDLLQQPTADLIEDDSHTGRRLLQDEDAADGLVPESHECVEASQAAFGQCKKVVNTAYVGCTGLFNGAAGTRL
jgi:hypothetical protein